MFFVDGVISWALTTLELKNINEGRNYARLACSGVSPIKFLSAT